MPFDEPVECPLCMEPLDIDDMNFYPCTCGYQICRFCWHRIRTDENSLCPACRKQYQEDPAEFKPLTDEELTSIKKERRQKDMARKQKAAENRRHLANIRVVQKNLVFVVGLSNRLAETEVLKRQEYFGKYGKILKVVINSSTSYAGAQGPSASAYITYTKAEDCLRAIQAVNNLYVDGRTLKASLGTTKYCSHFLKGTQCGKADCMYLHELGEEEASFTKDEMQAGKHQDYELKLNEQYLAIPSLCPTATSTTTASSKPTVNDQALTVEPPIAVTGSSTSKVTAASRKKTDSGSSAGSSKTKEPWPLLNKTVSNGDTVINLTELSSSPLPDDILTSSDHLGLPDSDDTRPQRTGGRSCSPQSSSCSTTSNPRTPTPDTVSQSSHSPRISENTVTTTGTDTLSTLTSVTTSTDTENPAPLLHPPAARRLPFSDCSVPSSYLPTADHSSFFPNPKDPSLDLRLSNTDSLQFTGLSKVDAPMHVSNPLANWQPAANQPLTSDDDLGFDPFLESNKGLADMLESENGYTSHMMPNYRSPLVRQPPPGVPAPPHLSHTGLFSTADGIMSSVMSPLMSVVTSSSSPLPPPPPGLSSFPQFPNSPVPPSSTDPAALRGSRMLNLLNLNHTSQQVSSSAPGMIPSSPVHNMPNRNMYPDTIMSHHMPQPHSSFNGMPNGMSDTGSFNTQDLRESLKALLPNASINFAPGISNQQQPLHQSRLRNNYMPNNSHALNHSLSWNGSSTVNAVDDQFSDPAIVSGCLSAERSASSSDSQPHWMKSIQQLTEATSTAPVSQHLQAAQQHQAPNAFRPPATHSRMPFAQNISMSQNRSSSGWSAQTAHNPPPGFPSSLRPATAQSSRMATLES